MNSVKDQANNMSRAAIAEQLNPQHPASGFMDLLNKRDQAMLTMITQLLNEQVKSAVKAALDERKGSKDNSMSNRPPSCPPRIHQSAPHGGDATLQSAQHGEVVGTEGGTDQTQ